jgi:glycosyltransferase involved in cell wall biosynthesis
LKIAFQNLGSDSWQAGQTFLEGIFAALHSLGREKPELVLIVVPNTPQTQYERLAPYVDEVLSVAEAPAPPAIRPPARSRTLRAYIRRLSAARRPVADLPADPLSSSLIEHEVDAYFSIAWGPARRIATPQIKWIFDFQHHHFPRLFSAEECRARDELFREHGRAASRVLVTAESVLQDLVRFDPDLGTKAGILRFVPNIPGTAYTTDPTETLQRYHLPTRFFYLPNQWWQHKNHGLVFDALGLLQDGSARPVIVSTGALLDGRNPAYVEEQIQKLSLKNIREQVIMLGRVSRTDVFSLYRQSICVLNPTQFEGLGLSVAEAHSLGKRALLADLPVLREQAVPGAVYFNPQDPHELARRMEQIWDSAQAGPDLDREAAARRALPERQRVFAKGFLGMAQAAIDHKHSHPEQDSQGHRVEFRT